MLVRFEDGPHRREVEVRLHDPGALVADLAAALDPTVPARTMLVDGRAVPAGRRIDRAGLRPGVTVTLGPPPGADPPIDGGRRREAAGPTERAVVALASVGGLDAARWWPLPPGRHQIGRSRPVPTSPTCAGAGAGQGEPLVALRDAAVSAVHAEVAVEEDGGASIVDLGSRNGTWVGAEAIRDRRPIGVGTVVRCGATQLRIFPTMPAAGSSGPAGGVTDDPSLARSGPVPLNRPPRPADPPASAPLDAPTPAPPAVAGAPVGVVGIVAPLVLGLVMVRLLHSWTYALFMLLSPVMVVGGAVESRRRGRRVRRRDAARFRAELAGFQEQLRSAADVERDRLDRRLPDPAEMCRRAVAGGPLLWERRLHHGDALALRAGTGPVHWEPPVSGDPRGRPAEVRMAIEAAATLPDAPVEVALRDGGVVGIVGPRAAALAVARSLVVQAAAGHGPADLVIAVLTSAVGIGDWDWAKWLPHTVDPVGGGRLLAGGEDAAAALAGTLVDRAVGGPRGGADGRREPVVLVVTDRPEVATGGPLGRLLARGGPGAPSAVVVAAAEDLLPAACTTVIALTGADGAGEVTDVDRGTRLAPLLAAGLAEPTARAAARGLARFEDPDGAEGGRPLPGSATLPPLLGLTPLTAATVGARWQAGGADPAPIATLGVGARGPFTVDLHRDGPHALVAGTTGAGKSELLRTLVASLAAGAGPEHITFLLVDFKGGSAFDECARLPHTVGVVTDLDAHLAARALRCLEAELRHRERRLRSVGAEDLTAYRRGPRPGPPMPRLVVVVDEFATLTAELPTFVPALVGVAQRGRSLGVHLVLATQRPSGAVSDQIRANTNLRIALRVQDEPDSRDVIDGPEAARLPRGRPGRALVRLGAGEVVAVQVAQVTAPSDVARGPVEVLPFRFGPGPDAGPDTGAPAGAETDLARLVAASGAAFAAGGGPLPRRPWPDPLPLVVTAADVAAAAEAGADRPAFGTPDGAVDFALADLPDEQRVAATGWRPAEGNLLLVGIGGSGTTTTAASIVLAAAARTSPGDLHVQVLDFGAGDLAPLAGLPHCGNVVAADDRERQQRLLRCLGAELRRRRQQPVLANGAPHVLLVVDGLAGFRATWGDGDLDGRFDDLVRFVADGPDVGLHTVITADRAGAVPAALAGLVRQRLVFRLGERGDHGAFGIAPSAVPLLPPGRALVPEGPVVVQVALPTPDLATAVATVADHWSDRLGGPRPHVIRALPAIVTVDELTAAGGRATTSRHPWCLPVGLAEATLAACHLELHAGEHALVAGPPRSGRTTALRVIAAAVAAEGRGVLVAALADSRSGLAATPGLAVAAAPAQAGRLLARLAAHPGPVLLLVDDADRFGDDDGALVRLLEAGRPDVHVIAAGRAERLRHGHAPWTREVRAARRGLLLQPDPDLDGDLLACRIPRRSPVALTPGRGWRIADSAPELIQVASMA